MSDQPEEKKKNPHAVALGRRGGSKKTHKPKGLAAQTPERRAEIQALALAAKRKKKISIDSQ